MMRLPVRSRNANVFFAVLGAIYAVSALVVLTWFVVDVWHADGLSDRLLQFALVVAGACGVWFAVQALQNLGYRAGGTSYDASTHK